MTIILPPANINETAAQRRTRLRTAIQTHTSFPALKALRAIRLEFSTMAELYALYTELYGHAFDNDALASVNVQPVQPVQPVQTIKADNPFLGTPLAPIKPDTRPPAPAKSAPIKPAPAAQSNDLLGMFQTLILNTLAEHGISQHSPAIDETAVKSIIEAHMKAQSYNPPVRIERADGKIETIKGHTHPQFKKLLTVATIRLNGVPLNIYLAGPSAAGKSYICHQMATAMAIPFYTQGSMVQSYELLGFIDASGHYHTTPFVNAYRNGGVILLDEVDAGDNSALLALNAALANGHIALPTGELLNRHKDCVIIAAANTWGQGGTADYVGRTKLDAAFLDRFVYVAMDYDEVFERAISGNQDWAIHVQRTRAKAKAKGLKVMITPRASIYGAALLAAGFSQADTIAMTYGNKLTADQRKLLDLEG